MKNSKLLGGILLIAGTTVGAGILALPLSTGLGGFYPAALLFLICWMMMLWTSYLILELSLYFENEVNLASIAKLTLGRLGASVVSIMFLMMLYSLLAAYISGSSMILTEEFNNLAGVKLNTWTGALPLLTVFTPPIYFGLRSVDKINRILMIGLVASYVFIVLTITPYVDIKLLEHIDFSHAVPSLSVIVVTFGYHIIIPSLITYMKRDVKKIKICIFIGSFMPLIAYLVFEMLILGVIPVHGENGIAYMLKNKISISKGLKSFIVSDYAMTLMILFSVFAIVTSFLGVAQGLFDFIKDELQIKNNHKGRALVFFLTFMPPIAFTFFYPKGFQLALEYAGIFLSVLLGIFPIAMVWQARYRKKIKLKYEAFGGKLTLVLGMMFFLLIIFIVSVNSIGMFNADIEKYLS